jgi:hypothetical protein
MVPRLVPFPRRTGRKSFVSKVYGNDRTMEQYKHPCLIADTQFHERMRKEVAVG